MAELHDSHAKIIDENKKLRNGLALSIEKLEKYRDELENSKSLNANLEENLRKTKDNEVSNFHFSIYFYIFVKLPC